MFVNNFCDLDEDIWNYCYIFLYYIGRKMGVLLFNVLYYVLFLVVVVLVVINFLYLIMLLLLIIIYLVYCNLVKFNKE